MSDKKERWVLTGEYRVPKEGEFYSIGVPNDAGVVEVQRETYRHGVASWMIFTPLDLDLEARLAGKLLIDVEKARRAWERSHHGEPCDLMQITQMALSAFDDVLAAHRAKADPMSRDRLIDLASSIAKSKSVFDAADMIAAHFRKPVSP